MGHGGGHVADLAAGNELARGLWGAAFVVRESDEIRFDLLLSGASPGTRRAMTFLSAAALVILFLASLPAVVDYVTFMKVQSTAYLRVRFDVLFSIYVIFAVAAIIRYLSLGWRAITDADRSRAPSGP